MSDDEEHSTEAEQALKKRRDVQRQASHGLDDAAKELLEANRKDREQMEDDINELRKRNKQRKAERDALEKKLAAQRAAEDERRKAVDEEKRKKKDEEEQKRQKERANKAAEYAKQADVGKRNFVISKRTDSREEGEEAAAGIVKKSKEQLDAEKKAILKQRIPQLESLSGFDAAKLTDKVKDLHKLICRLEGEKYDLEKRFKNQQIDMMELAERARQANKVGKGGLKRIQHSDESEIDTIQARFAGAPAKVEMYSKYERQKDKRSYSERLKVHSGPQYCPPVEKIPATKILKWTEEGLPIYEEIPGAEGHAEAHE